MTNIFILLLIAFGGTFRSSMVNSLPATTQEYFWMAIQPKTYNL